MNNKMRFRGIRKDDLGTIEGFYFETPLTAEVNAPSESGLFFLSGENEPKRYCISDEDGCVHEVYPETVICIQVTDLIRRIRQFKVVEEVIIKGSTTPLPIAKSEARTKAYNNIMNELNRLGIE